MKYDMNCRCALCDSEMYGYSEDEDANMFCSNPKCEWSDKPDKDGSSMFLNEIKMVIENANNKWCNNFR